MLFPQNPGLAIREAREKAGLTQRQLADELGVHWRAVQFWEAGERVPQRGNREKLNRFFENHSVQSVRGSRKRKRS